MEEKIREFGVVPVVVLDRSEEYDLAINGDPNDTQSAL